MNFKTWMENVIPCGDCFRFAVKHAIEMFTDGIVPDKEITVVHAVVHPKWHNRDYEHAWVEAIGRCYDWQMSINRTGSLPIKEFYKEYKPTQIKKYTRVEAMRKMVSTGNYGPWDDDVSASWRKDS